jgi:hypothetical protein
LCKPLIEGKITFRGMNPCLPVYGTPVPKPRFLDVNPFPAYKI